MTRTYIVMNGEKMEAEDLRWRQTQDLRGRFECEDGTVIDATLVVTRICRVLAKKNDNGEPIYQLQHQLVLGVHPAANLMEG